MPAILNIHTNKNNFQILRSGKRLFLVKTAFFQWV